MHDPQDVSTPIRRPDVAARRAGMFLLITAGATALMVFARISAGADQPTLLESLRVIADNKPMYETSGTARFISGITLAVGAWFLLKTWIIRERLGTPLVPYAFAASGAFTAVSGACAIALALSLPDASDPAITNSIETINHLRWLTGKIGFTIAGLALLVAARYQWRAGATLRRVSPASAIIGGAMQFIWIDSATLVHPMIGAAFFVWLIVISFMLVTGSVERRFAALKP